MAQPREKQAVLFTFATICSILALGGFGFFLYILPHILFNVHYDVPEFVIQLTILLKEHRDIDGYLFVSLMLLPILLGSIVFAIIARILSDKLQPHREDEAQAVGIAARQAPTTTEEPAEETQQVTYRLEARTIETVNEKGEVISVETEQPQVVAEPSKPKLFETAAHVEPIKYSKSQAFTLAAKLGILIAAILLLIILADIFMVADMAHLFQ